MAYLIFEYDSSKSADDLVRELSSNSNWLGGDVSAIKRELFRPSDKAIQDMTADHLVAQLVRHKRARGFELLKSKKEISTDSPLIGTYGSNYVGYVGGDLKKDSLINMLDIWRKTDAYEYLRARTEPTLLEDKYKALSLTIAEANEYMSELVKGSAERDAWVANHSKATNLAFNTLPTFIKRGF
jgi:hypothetical protein